MQHMRTSQKVTTVFDFDKMASRANNYSPDLTHPMNHELVFRAADGSEVKMFVGQIATLVAIANKMASAGKAIDNMFSFLTEAEITEICRKY